MIAITPYISIDERDLEETFVRAAGPGGQNVNKVSTAVMLRYNLAGAALPDDMRERAARLAGRRLTNDGVIVIQANRFRTQELNRQDALDRLIEILRKAAIRPITRRPTRPTLASKKRRLEAKSHRATIKAGRGGPSSEPE